MRRPAARLLHRRHLTPPAYPSPLVIMPEQKARNTDVIALLDAWLAAKRAWLEVDTLDGVWPRIVEPVDEYWQIGDDDNGE